MCVCVSMIIDLLVSDNYLNYIEIENVCFQLVSAMTMVLCVTLIQANVFVQQKALWETTVKGVTLRIIITEIQQTMVLVFVSIYILKLLTFWIFNINSW